VYSPVGLVPLTSHLLTPTKSNSYFDTDTIEPALYRLLTFQVPNLISTLRPFIQGIRPSLRLFQNFHNKLISHDNGLLASCSTPSWRTTPCRLSAAVHLMYSQLPSIARGRPSLCNPRSHHTMVPRDPPNM
jgi:hypothetical protein